MILPIPPPKKKYALFNIPLNNYPPHHTRWFSERGTQSPFLLKADPLIATKQIFLLQFFSF